MAEKLRDKVVKALGLNDKASITEIRGAIDRELTGEMTPEEKAALDKAEEERRKKEADAAREMGEIRAALGLEQTATTPNVLAALATLRDGGKTLTEVVMQSRSGQETLASQVRELSARVTALAPKAELAEKLEKEQRARDKEAFFTEQLRKGKMAPADRPFYESMWEFNEKEVRAHFENKPANVRFSTDDKGHGAATRPDLPEGVDAREQLKELATKRAAEKSISFTEALKQIQAEQPELQEKVASHYGPAGIGR